MSELSPEVKTLIDFLKFPSVSTEKTFSEGQHQETMLNQALNASGVKSGTTRAIIEFAVDVTSVAAVTTATKNLATKAFQIEAQAAKGGGRLWSSRPPGVQVRQFGDIWVKRVNPESNALMQWWGQKSINAQYRGLQALGDMATPSTMRNGMLFTRSVGETLPDGFRLLNSSSRGAYLQGSRRMGTFFNDIQPRNMGTNGLIFDPAIDPVTKALFWGGAGAAAYGSYKLSD